MSKPTAVVLARVSSKGQEDGYSLESQLKLLREYCRTKNYVVKKEFRIAETASKAQERRVFNELLQYLSEQNVHHLAVEKTDRLTRNLKDAVAVDDWLQADQDRQLHAVKESLVLHKDAKSDVKFMWNIHLAVAKKYTDNLREETMKGWTEKLAQGWMPAPPPPGYTTVVRDGKKIHVPDTQTAKLVSKAFTLYLQPEHSIRSIVEYLESVGVRTRTGRPFTKPNIYKMLKNPFYTGQIRFNGKSYVGAQKPIVTSTVFEAVQAKLNDKSPHKKRKHEYPLKGVMTCTYCGKLITWWKVKSYTYGSCQRSTEDCKKKKYVREDSVQQEIQKSLNALRCPAPELMELLIDSINYDAADFNQSLQDEINTAKRDLERYKRMDDMLYEDKLLGEIPPEKYREKHAVFTEKMEGLEARLASLSPAQDSDLLRRVTCLA